MSLSHKFRDQEKLHFVTFSVVNWIDVFTRPIYRDDLLKCLRFCQKHKGLEIYAWCIMSNHVHMIIGTHGMKLEHIMRDVKKHTSKAIVKLIRENDQESRKDWMIWLFEREGQRNPNNKEHQFWQQGNHPTELFTHEVIMQKLNYIHDNPVKAGWVDTPEHYLYSSARDYAGMKGLLDIIHLNTLPSRV